MKVARSSCCKTWSWQLAICLLIAVFCIPKPVASALEVEAVYWGFNDGSVPSHMLTPLHVKVFNPADRNWEGQIMLLNSDGLALKGERQATEVLVTPGGRRWLHFHPWDGPQGDWQIRWRGNLDNGSAAIQDIPEEQTGLAMVYLHDVEGLADHGIRMTSMPERLFPVQSALCDGLGVVVIATEPSRMRTAQRQALLDWLYQGGHVILVPPEGQQQVDMSPQWGPLSQASGDRWYGRGRITVLPKLKRPIQEATLRKEAAVSTRFLSQSSHYGYDHVASRLYPSMRSVQQPHHAWGLLALVLLLYALALFPGLWLLARRQVDYRILATAFILLCLGMTWIMKILGAQGYEDEKNLLTVTYANQLPDDRWAVQQWGTLFVTDGGMHTVVGPQAAMPALFTAANTDDAVAMQVPLGGNGAICDIPLFSSVSFHRANTESLPLKGGTAQCTKWTFKAERLSCYFTVPRQLQGGLAVAVYQGKVYRLSSAPDGYTYERAEGLDFKSYLEQNQPLHHWNMHWAYNDEGKEMPPNGVLSLLLGHANGGHQLRYRMLPQSQNDGQIRLFILKDSIAFRPVGYEESTGIVCFECLVTVPQGGNTND